MHVPYAASREWVRLVVTCAVQAGGASSCDGLCKSALDIPINAYDQRTEICFGSTGEVRRFEEYLYGKQPAVSWASCCPAVFLTMLHS